MLATYSKYTLLDYVIIFAILSLLNKIFEMRLPISF